MRGNIPEVEERRSAWVVFSMAQCRPPLGGLSRPATAGVWEHTCSRLGKQAVSSVPRPEFSFWLAPDYEMLPVTPDPCHSFPYAQQASLTYLDQASAYKSKSSY